jgi:IS5 family transposase
MQKSLPDGRNVGAGLHGKSPNRPNHHRDKLRQIHRQHQSQSRAMKLDHVLDKSNTSNEVWGDSPYRSAEMEAKLKEQGYKSRIHRRSGRSHPSNTTGVQA